MKYLQEMVQHVGHASSLDENDTHQRGTAKSQVKK